MQKTIKIHLFVVALLVFSSLVFAAEVNEHPSSALLTSKQTGLEARVTPDITYSPTGVVIDLFYDPTLSASDKDKLENNDISFSGYTFKKKTKKTDRLTVELDRKSKEQKTDKEKKSSSYIKYGTNTLLLEEDDYYTLENSGQIWYISKSGFHLSNVPNESYAQMHYELVFPNQSFNSHPQVWEWEINNGTDYVSLTATTYIPEYQINWTMKYELDDRSYFLNATSSTNNTALPYTQVFAHHDFNISANSIEDEIIFDRNRYGVDTDIVSGTDDYHKIIDPLTTVEIEIQLQEPLPFTLSGGHLEIESSNSDPFTVAWNDGAGNAHILGRSYNFSDAVTTSTSYVNIGTGTFILNQSIPTTFHISLNSEKTAGSGVATQFDYRLVVDGVPTKEITRELSKNVPTTILFSHHLEEVDMTAGQHNFTLQHKVVGANTLTTTHPQAFVQTMFMQNFSQINHAYVEGITHNITDNVMRMRYNTSFTVNEEGKDLLIFLDASVDTPSGTADSVYAIEVDGQRSHHTSQTVSTVAPTGAQRFEHYHVFTNLSAGSHNISIVGKSTDPAVNIIFDGDLQILDTHADELDINYDFTGLMGKTVTDTGSFQTIANTTLNIEEGNDYVNFATFSTNKITGGTDDLEIQMILDGVITTPLWTKALTSATINGAVGIYHTFGNLTEGNHTVVLLARPEIGSGETFTIFNISMTAIETIDLAGFSLPVDNPPEITVNSPSNGATLTNQETITHSCSFTDNSLDYVSLYHNGTGTFSQEQIVDVSGSTLTYLFNETYPLNSSILWGCWANDTIGQSTFSENRTFTNPQVFPPDFAIELINPANNSIDIDGLVNFRFTIDDITNATLYHNLSGSIAAIETIETINGLNSFTQIEFTSNATLQWFVGAPNTNNSFHILTLNLTVDPNEITGEFSTRNCPAQEVGTSLFIGIMLFFALGLVFATLVSGAGVFAMFAGFMIIILSWYIAPCIGILSFAVGGFGIVLIIWSVTSPGRMN